MIGLYKHLHIDRVGVIHPSWKNVESQLRLDFDRYHKWFRSSNGIVDNNNLLVRILWTLDLDVKLSYGDYLVSVNHKWGELGNHFETTSFSDKGITFDNIIETSNVALVTHLDGGTRSNWTSMVPLRFIQTKSTSLQFKDLYKDKTVDDESNVTHMSLDIMEFALMYRGWKLDRMAKDQDSNIANFIYAYVIPNAMETLFNLSIINRYFMDGFDKGDDVVVKSEFRIKTRYSIIDRFIKDNRDYLSKQVETYYFYLGSIPVFQSTAQKELLLDFQMVGLNLLTFAVAARIKVYTDVRNYFDNGTGNVNYINNDIHTEVWLKATIVSNNKTLLNSKIVDEKTKFLIRLIKKEK